MKQPACTFPTVGTLPALVLLAGLIPSSSHAAGYFRIHVVDDATGRGVPLVELTTVNGILHVTDSAGMVAFHEPGLMGQPVWFTIRSHGYEYRRDGFGYRGVRLTPVDGETATVRLQRTNIAERLYRITGAGCYRDSVLLGDTPVTAQPLLNAQVVGQDSVQTAVYGNQLYWFWGDTSRAAYPLGNFHTTAATSQLPTAGGLPQDAGINLSYLQNESGFVKSVAEVPGKGPTWIDAVTVVPDAAGDDVLLAKYVKIQPPLTAYERGLLRFNDARQEFEKAVTFDFADPVYPRGHALRVAAHSREYVYFADPFPWIRTIATAESVLDTSGYECWTCFVNGDDGTPAVDRDDAGQLRFAWRSDAVPITRDLIAQSIRAGTMSKEESPITVVDSAGRQVTLHSGTVNWNPYRRRWVMIAVETFGSSLLGEVWYTEADHIEGPWLNARRIVTHDDYSFYNPMHHVEFDQQDGRVIYFEGTYTHMFSGTTTPTPRYDYNQIMYRLTLDDPRLELEQRN